MSGLPLIPLADLVQKLKDKITKPSVLQIGAMDGVSFDLLRPYLLGGEMDAVLLEPLPDIFEKLQENYKDISGVRLARQAISDHTGTLTMHRVDPSVIEKGYAKELLGMSTTLDNGGFFSSEVFCEKLPEVAQNHILKTEVPCSTLSDFLKAEKIDHVDFYMIDTEGADWIIAKQIDLKNNPPSLICLEHSGLQEHEKMQCISFFKSAGYQMALCAEDRENILFHKDI